MLDGLTFLNVFVSHTLLPLTPRHAGPHFPERKSKGGSRHLKYKKFLGRAESPKRIASLNMSRSILERQRRDLEWRRQGALSLTIRENTVAMFSWVLHGRGARKGCAIRSVMCDDSCFLIRGTSGVPENASRSFSRSAEGQAA